MKGHVRFAAILTGFLLLAGMAFGRAAASAQNGPSGIIAFVRNGKDIQLIAPDGTGERKIWTHPFSRSASGFSIQEIAWSPDGTELAFSSGHEGATSWFECDLYAIKADGTGLRKLTNPPVNSELASLPTGKVRVHIGNSRIGTSESLFVAYVMGATKAQTVIVPPGATRTVLFDQVAVMGNTTHPVMVANGGYRWVSPGVRVIAGQTLDASITLTGKGIQRLGAYRPVWCPDGKQVGYVFCNGAGIWRVSARPAPGAGTGQSLAGTGAKRSAAGFDWRPASTPGGGVLYITDIVALGERDNSIYQTDEEGSTPKRLVHDENDLGSFKQVRWLPDGSGFLFLKMDGNFASSANVYRCIFDGKKVDKITRLSNEYVRSFDVSPDGRWIVFERSKEFYFRSLTDKEGPSLWIVSTDGGDPRLLVKSAERPDWKR